tara:strand:+ start:3098 stop:3409 length:312 start_codon:yes stop_codon:yes gene_type:complete
VKYLKENLNLKIAKIAQLLNRDPKTIWSTYYKAKKKLEQKFEEEQSNINLPISIFKSRKLSFLESIVYHIKQKYDLTFHEIATLLKRDDRTIWTVYQKAKKKM